MQIVERLISHPLKAYKFSYSTLCLCISLGFSVGACQSSLKTSTNPIEENSFATETPIEFITTINNLHLRSAPNLKAAVLDTLTRNATVTGLGVTEATSSIQVKGISFDEPWWKVKTTAGKIGWLYGGYLNLAQASIKSIEQNTFLQQRLIGVFGNTTATAIQQYRTAYAAIKSSTDFAATHRMGLTIRDSIVKILENKTEIIDPIAPADLSWLEQALPGFKTQLVAEATLFHLFADYRDFDFKATATTEQEDDAFMNLLLQVYAADSTEQFYPSWFLQTWDYGGHSLLGSGKHLKIIKKLDALQRSTSLFNPEITTLKTALLKDLTADWVTYWESKKAIQKELKQIIKGNFSCFNEEERLLLQQRSVAFENPALNNISLNQKERN